MGLLNFSIAEERTRSELGVYINLRLLHLGTSICIQGLQIFFPVDVSLIRLFKTPQETSKSDKNILHRYFFCVSNQ